MNYFKEYNFTLDDIICFLKARYKYSPDDIDYCEFDDAF